MVEKSVSFDYNVYFTGNLSKNPEDTDYVPSLFFFTPASVEASDRAKRLARRNQKKITENEQNDNDVIDEEEGTCGFNCSDVENDRYEANEEMNGLDEEGEIGEPSQVDEQNDGEELCTDFSRDSSHNVGLVVDLHVDEEYQLEDQLSYQLWQQEKSSLESIAQEKEVEIGEMQIELDLLQNKVDELQETLSQLHQETAALRNERNGLLVENTLLKQRINFDAKAHTAMFRLQAQLLKVKFCATILKNDDEMTCFYTGLPTYKLFVGLFQILEPVARERNFGMHLIDEFFLVLVKLRLGVPHKDLAYRMNVSSSTISDIFQKWIMLMSIELKPLIVWPDDKDVLRKNMPKVFKKHFSSVMCIIDCFEIYIERPLYLKARALTYSNYKKKNTVKFLIAVTPTGSICFISQAWGGHVSDKVITQQSGFLKKLEYGDEVLADRGFNVSEDVAVCGARLRIPAYTRGKSQLSRKEVETSRQLARVRIHVERVIGQLRKKYSILSQTLPISIIKCPGDYGKKLCTIDKILIVTAALTNLSSSVVT